MTVTPTNNVSNGTSSSDAVPGSQQTLTQNDFLQLLVSQMENQDPLNPQSDTQMAAQMAQFTSLQQSASMSSSLSMLQANSLIGSTISVLVNPQSSATTTGVVQSVQTGASSTDGTPQVIINNKPYDLSQIVGIVPTPVSTPSTGTTPP